MMEYQQLSMFVDSQQQGTTVRKRPTGGSSEGGSSEGYTYRAE